MISVITIMAGPLCVSDCALARVCLRGFARATRAHQTAGDDGVADVWYNISHLAIGIGDLGLAYQAGGGGGLERGGRMEEEEG